MDSGDSQSARNLGSGNPAQWFSLLQSYRQVRKGGQGTRLLALTDGVQCCRLKSIAVASSSRLPPRQGLTVTQTRLAGDKSSSV